MSTERPQFDRREGTTATDQSLRDKTRVVTGASRGIGRTTAVDFARRDANLAVNCRPSTDDARAVVERIEADRGCAFAVEADVGDRDEGPSGNVTGGPDG